MEIINVDEFASEELACGIRSAAAAG